MSQADQKLAFDLQCYQNIYRHKRVFYDFVKIAVDIMLKDLYLLILSGLETKFTTKARPLSWDTSFKFFGCMTFGKLLFFVLLFKITNVFYNEILIKTLVVTFY